MVDFQETSRGGGYPPIFKQLTLMKWPIYKIRITYTNKPPFLLAIILGLVLS